jgi:hypothetical protein
MARDATKERYSMGTRADFYVGRGEGAEWLGSVAWDGYPEGFDTAGLLTASTEAEFRQLVAQEIAGRDDGTTPAMGWPWPWDNSQTTDYAYAFDGGEVWGSYFGHDWFDASEPQPDSDSGAKTAVFPDMSARKKVTMGARSGVILVSEAE